MIVMEIKSKMIKNSTKFKLKALFLLSLMSSCTNSFQYSNNKSFIQNNEIKSTITGKVEFPKTNKLNDNNLNYKVQATLSQVGDRATISLIYPPDDETNPNVTIATGLSDSNGAFSISTPNFEPITSKVYILEAIKRIGASSNDLISVRTYLRHNGTNWESITSPSININKETTAITIIDKNDNSITSSDTIGKIINGNINSINNVSVSTINNVAKITDFLLISNLDPNRFIEYKNNNYYITKEISANKNYLISYKDCPNCDLTNEDLSNKDLSSSDLSNANLKNTDLTNTDLSNADLSNADLTNAKLNNTNFSGAKWVNGITVCSTSSIGLCMYPDVLVNNFTTGNQINPSINEDFIIWQSENQDGSGSGIYAQRYNSYSNIPEVSEFRVNDYTLNDQTNPSISSNNKGDIVIAWKSENQDGSGSGIYRKRYNYSGIEQDFELKVNQYTTSNQLNPSVALDNLGNYVITWQSNQDNGYEIYSRRFNSIGIPVNSEFRVNTYTINHQINPSIAMNSNTGTFVITWESINQDGNSSGIYAQRYRNDGFPISSEFKVNTYTTFSQRNPAVAMDTIGNFIITWVSDNQDLGGNVGANIYAQRYNSLGIAQGSEFRVNSYTTNMKDNPSVSMSNSGNFVITWESQDENYSGIFAQRYNSLGIAQGNEFRVNSYTTNNQSNPNVSVDPIGSFIITWESESQDGNGSGVYLKRYYSDGSQLFYQ
ncbi:MAG: pentapeptide repeat-containing protein [Candidatus Sericytochromatia bacterium]